jgi:hypothetical protein
MQSPPFPNHIKDSKAYWSSLHGDREEYPEDRANGTVHVVTPSGDGIGFWSTVLWKLDDAKTETDMVGEILTTLDIMCDFCWKGIDPCGIVWSPA